MVDNTLLLILREDYIILSVRNRGKKNCVKQVVIKERDKMHNTTPPHIYDGKRDVGMSGSTKGSSFN